MTLFFHNTGNTMICSLVDEALAVTVFFYFSPKTLMPAKISYIKFEIEYKYRISQMRQFKTNAHSEVPSFFIWFR